jgi:DNA polymerase-3 subunit epsilon
LLKLPLSKTCPTGQRTVKRKLLNPQMPIPQVCVDIHGITDDMVKDAPTFKAVAHELKQFLDGCDLSCYNAYRLDIPMLVEEFIRAGTEFDMKSRKLIDVQKIFTRWSSAPWRQAYKFYCQKSLEGAHGAEVDAAATAEILMAQIQHYPQLGNTVILF